jgi:hypothetical protein
MEQLSTRGDARRPKTVAQSHRVEREREPWKELRDAAEELHRASLALAQAAGHLGRAQEFGREMWTASVRAGLAAGAAFDQSLEARWRQ